VHRFHGGTIFDKPFLCFSQIIAFAMLFTSFLLLPAFSAACSNLFFFLLLHHSLSLGDSPLMVLGPLFPSLSPSGDALSVFVFLVFVSFLLSSITKIIHLYSSSFSAFLPKNPPPPATGCPSFFGNIGFGLSSSSSASF